MQVFSCEFREIFKINMFYRTPPVAASSQGILKKIKNILSIFSLPGFAFHNRKFNQRCVLSWRYNSLVLCLHKFILTVYYTGLCSGRSEKEELLDFFVEHVNGNSHVKKQVVIFQSDITKFNQKRYFTVFLCYTGLCSQCSMKEALIFSYSKAL